MLNEGKRIGGDRCASCLSASYGPILLSVRISILLVELTGKFMVNECWLFFSISVIGLVAIIGFFVTKTKGYGRYATSTFLILVSLIIAALIFAADKLDRQVMANLLFAVIGFSGGLFTGKEQEKTSQSNT